MFKARAGGTQSDALVPLPPRPRRPPQLPRNAVVELPLWLLPELHARNMVAPRLPKQYRKR